MHSVVPVESGPAVGETVTAQQARARLERDGIVIPDARRFPASSTLRFPALATGAERVYAARRDTSSGWPRSAAHSSSHGAGSGK